MLTALGQVGDHFGFICQLNFLMIDLISFYVFIKGVEAEMKDVCGSI